MDILEKIEIAKKLTNEDASSAKMAELLMDDQVSTCEMFEDLLYDYEKGSEEFRKGMDKAMQILLNINFSEVIDEVIGDDEYYEVTQSRDKSEMVFLYSKRQILDGFAENNIDTGLIPKYGKDVSKNIGWPMDGNDTGSTLISCLGNMKDVLEYLRTVTTDGPYSNDALLSDLAAYSWEINTEEGCAKEILALSNMGKEEIEKSAMQDFDEKVSGICKKLGIAFEDLGKPEYSGIKVSEI